MMLVGVRVVLSMIPGWLCELAWTYWLGIPPCTTSSLLWSLLHMVAACTGSTHTPTLAHATHHVQTKQAAFGVSFKSGRFLKLFIFILPLFATMYYYIG